MIHRFSKQIIVSTRSRTSPAIRRSAKKQTRRWRRREEARMGDDAPKHNTYRGCA